MALNQNFTAPLERDLESRQRLWQFTGIFPQTVQSVVDAAMAKSEPAHFVHVLVIDALWDAIAVHGRRWRRPWAGRRVPLRRYAQACVHIDQLDYAE